MNSAFRISCLIIPVILVSCISRRSLMQGNLVLKRDISPETINGNYSNVGDSSQFPDYFYDYVIDYNSRVLRKTTDSTLTDSLSVISLEYDNENLLTIRVFQNEQLVKETDIRVKKKDDILLFKRHFFLLPIPFLFYWFDERRMAIVSGTDGDLHVYRRSYYFGWILMAAGADYRDKQSFKKL